MKIKFDHESRLRIASGIIVTFVGVLTYFLFLNFNGIQSSIQNIFNILFPFIVGFIIAFLLNPLMICLEQRIFLRIGLKPKLSRNLASMLALCIGLVLVVVFMIVVANQLRESVESLMKNYPSYIQSFEEFLESFFKRFNLNKEEIPSIAALGKDFIAFLSQGVKKFAPQMFNAGIGFVLLILRILIGIIAGLYLLMDKEKFLRQCKKLNYAIFPLDVAHYLNHFMKILKRIFYDFIVGKSIDSFIIGIICYIGMSIFGFKYAALISVIIAITNMIPVFGPFIGAVPGALLLLIVDPIQSVYFLIFVFVLQQFDGNILGPYILGDKLGIPSFWILFSVTIGGALFGFVGMFIGVPVFAAIYYLVKEFVDYRLSKKQIKI